MWEREREDTYVYTMYISTMFFSFDLNFYSEMCRVILAEYSGFHVS